MNYQEIYNEIKRDIILLKIKPGESISEADLTKKYKISRTPIRDIIKRLENENLLEVRPQKGTFVTSIDVSMLYEVMFLREVLEIAVAKEIIEKGDIEKLMTVNFIVARQRYIIDNSLSDEERAEKFLDLDDEFHETLFKIANKSFLWEVISRAKPHYYRVRYLLNLRNKVDMLTVCDQHQRILNAIINKSHETLRKEYHGHIYEGVKDLNKIIDNYHEYFKI
jgi:DNA-binding GntR family transcriptional regulator